MKRISVLLLIFYSSAVAGETPKVLAEALDAYVTGEPHKFLQMLLRGSPLDGEEGVRSQSVMIEKFKGYYGNPIEWEVVDECQETTKLRTIYFIAYHQSGPIFGSALMYTKPRGTEVVTSFGFHAEIDKVFPKKHLSRSLCDA